MATPANPMSSMRLIHTEMVCGKRLGTGSTWTRVQVEESEGGQFEVQGRVEDRVGQRRLVPAGEVQQVWGGEQRQGGDGGQRQQFHRAAGDDRARPAGAAAVTGGGEGERAAGGEQQRVLRCPVPEQHLLVRADERHRGGCEQQRGEGEAHCTRGGPGQARSGAGGRLRRAHTMWPRAAGARAPRGPAARRWRARPVQRGCGAAALAQAQPGAPIVCVAVGFLRRAPGRVPRGVVRPGRWLSAESRGGWG